ncbi:MAG: AraC family transcriptional regulator [Clostridiaceae bacterium]|nr:AraC family transcriptional regulator [Clostridiaceae bacterium]
MNRTFNNGIPINTIDITYEKSSEAKEIKLHFHSNYQVIYICEGSIKFTINKKTYTVGADSIIFISHLESHELKILNFPYKRYLIRIKPDYLSSVVNEPILVSIFKNRPETFKHAINLKREESAVIRSLISKMHAEMTNSSAFSLAAVGSYMQLLLISLYRSHRSCFPLSGLDRSFNLVMQVQKYIEENILEQITLKSTAKLFYTDMYYLSHLFKEISGFTFKEYIILQRLSRAKDLLIHTNQNITEVAMNSGFGNVNHFIRTFKKQERITPLQYRKNYR